ncbi:MAG: hypothetical protein OXD42_05705 [Rhodospirillaceae bacterium]|nr:hypothetical protein [Rhodospirillaceae bacterium]MCY4239688.1 hypothetical protein [Rhodospirillaceae bacterium]
MLSTADSFEDIVPNVIKALSPFFEDDEPVSPRGIEAVAGSIAKGTVLMMIPYAGPGDGACG